MPCGTKVQIPPGQSTGTWEAQKRCRHSIATAVEIVCSLAIPWHHPTYSVLMVKVAATLRTCKRSDSLKLSGRVPLSVLFTSLSSYTRANGMCVLKHFRPQRSN